MKLSGLSVRYVLVMTFIGIVLGISLLNTGINTLAALGIWIFVLLGFGTYLYFRMFRQQRRKRNPEDPEE